MFYKDSFNAMLDEMFANAMAAAASRKALDKDSSLARTRFDEGFTGEAGFKAEMDAIAEEREQVTKRLGASIAAAREKFESETKGALSLDPSSLDPQTVSYLNAVALSNNEAQRMLNDAASRGDLATIRLIEANVSRQGKHVRSGIDQYLEKASSIADEAARYANIIGGEDSKAYLENRETVMSMLEGKMSEAESAFKAFPIVEANTDEG